MVLSATSFGTILKFILIAYGHINTCVFPTSHPGYALCSSVCRAGIPCKMKDKLSQHDIASYTAKRHQLVCCWQASISVNWAVGGVCKVFACLLGSYLASF